MILDWEEGEVGSKCDWLFQGNIFLRGTRNEKVRWGGVEEGREEEKKGTSSSQSAPLPQAE